MKKAERAKAARYRARGPKQALIAGDASTPEGRGAAAGPDLTKVDEVGFADLLAGGGHRNAGYVNIGAFEVYGKPVKR